MISNSDYLKYRYYENIINPLINDDKREKFLKNNIQDYHSQVFLHYVNQDGKYKDHIWDKRNYLGEPKDGI